jgi:hypothetical protein
MTDNLYLTEGFFYWDERMSPDGALRVVVGYSDGERTPSRQEPRVYDAATGEVLLDLWHTAHTYSVRFGEAGRLTLIVQDPYRGTSRTAEIDLRARTFAFADESPTRGPLAALRERITRRAS